MTLCKGFIFGLYVVKKKKWYFYIFNYLKILTSFANGPLLFSEAKAKLLGGMSTRY